MNQTLASGVVQEAAVNRNSTLPSNGLGKEDLTVKRIATITLLALALAAVPFLSAQTSSATHTPPSPATMVQHRVSYLTTLLSLTPEQQTQATTIFTNAASSASSLHTQMKTARQNLEAAIQKNDTASISQISATIGSLTTQMTQAEATAKAAFYQTLTADQQTKLTQLESNRGSGMGFMRRGF